LPEATPPLPGDDDAPPDDVDAPLPDGGVNGAPPFAADVVPEPPAPLVAAGGVDAVAPAPGVPSFPELEPQPVSAANVTAARHVASTIHCELARCFIIHPPLCCHDAMHLEHGGPDRRCGNWKRHIEAIVCRALSIFFAPNQRSPVRFRYAFELTKQRKTCAFVVRAKARKVFALLAEFALA
jgi:hypothetical protein